SPARDKPLQSCHGPLGRSAHRALLPPMVQGLALVRGAGGGQPPAGVRGSAPAPWLGYFLLAVLISFSLSFANLAIGVSLPNSTAFCIENSALCGRCSLSCAMPT